MGKDIKSFLKKMLVHKKGTKKNNIKVEPENNISQNIINVSGHINIVNDEGKIYDVTNEFKNIEKKYIIRDKNVNFQKNKKQDYIKIWNSRLFLHQDSNEKPITLADAFIMPDYKIYQFVDTIASSIYDPLDNIIEKFIEYDKASTMLITGVPGIGKSTIISWIAYKYKKDDRVFILRFRDWESEELENGLLKAICNSLKCKKRNLEYKILVLDGFDEMKAVNIRESLLNAFFNDILDFNNLKIVFTSRPSYIEPNYFENVIELLPFNIHKIKRFHYIIKNSELDTEKIDLDNLDILGIPVILYMSIMTGLDITKKATKPELYNRIFAEKGGIFDKFFYKGVGYDKGSQPLRDRNNIKKYLEFLQNIAFLMFKKDVLVLSKRECEIPELDFNGHKISVLEFPIKYLFENTESHIEFIHKSIYEYFVSEYIFLSINKEIYSDEINAANKGLACILGKIFHRIKLSPEILEFLKYKIGNSTLNNKFNIIIETFKLMLQDGMTYYTSKTYKNAIHCEMVVFSNMLEIIHLWKDDINISLPENFVFYLRHNHKNMLNLENMDLEGLYLCGFDLRKVNLAGTNLEKAVLEKANLTGANLTGANLTEANLTGTDLFNANLTRTNLRGTNLINTNIEKAILKETNLSETNLERINFNKFDLERMTFNKPDFKKINLIRANLRGANLSGIDLREADLTEANLKGANLGEADLRGADLTDIDLIDAKLKEVLLDENQVNCLKNKYDLRETKVYIEKTKDIISYEKYCELKQ